MRVLGIDTSAGIEVALVADTQVLGRAQIQDSHVHAEQLSAAILDAVFQAGYMRLAEAGIELVAVGTGPAPFTGLRAGLVAARTIASVLGVPVAGVCSLDALARAAFDRLPADSQVLAVSDAKRREVYSARYSALGANDVTCVAGPSVGSARQAANIPDEVIVVGETASLYPQEFRLATDLPGRVDAAYIARLAVARTQRGVEQPTEPLYLRRPDIHQGGSKKTTLG